MRLAVNNKYLQIEMFTNAILISAIILCAKNGNMTENNKYYDIYDVLLSHYCILQFKYGKYT